MKKIFHSYRILALVFLLFSLSSCGTIGDKDASMSIIYGSTLTISLSVFLGYLFIARKKEAPFILLLLSVAVVNGGYFMLSLSQTLNFALWANRISYLGSVFLPFSMMIIALDASKIKPPKCLKPLLLIIALGVFLVAASPGYLDIYYKEVTLDTAGGVSTLNKVYGPWHKLYLFYLVGYFIAMLAVVIYAALKRKTGSVLNTVILATALFVNTVVWLFEQLVKLDFEILSVSYIISEFFLLGLLKLLHENEELKALAENANSQISKQKKASDNYIKEASTSASSFSKQKILDFKRGIETLTQTEKTIFNLYISGKTTKEILSFQNITENTLKFHNKNIYSKLSVSSKKELLQVYKALFNEKAQS